MDWIGDILCIGCIVSLLLALQWGGTQLELPWEQPENHCSFLRVWSITVDLFSLEMDQLRRNLAISAPNLPATVISALEQSVTVLGELDPSVRESVLQTYTHSVAQTFLIEVPASALVSLCALYVGNFSLYIS